MVHNKSSYNGLIVSVCMSAVPSSALCCMVMVPNPSIWCHWPSACIFAFPSPPPPRCSLQGWAAGQHPAHVAGTLPIIIILISIIFIIIIVFNRLMWWCDVFRDRMTAAECLEHKWLKDPGVKSLPPVPGASSLAPVCRVPSISDSPSGQRRALASTQADDDESDDTLSLREPAKKCRCDIDVKQEPVDHDRPSVSSSDDKENCVDVEKCNSPTTWKLDSAESSTLCSTPTTAAVAKTLVSGVCIDISVA